MVMVSPALTLSGTGENEKFLMLMDAAPVDGVEGPVDAAEPVAVDATATLAVVGDVAVPFFELPQPNSPPLARAATRIGTRRLIGRRTLGLPPKWSARF
jgi:hypothetical protein